MESTVLPPRSPRAPPCWPQRLRLLDAQGAVISSSGGRLWITQESDARDVFLKPGEHFTFDRPGLVLVCALEDASIGIRAPAPRQPGGSARWSHRARSVLRSWLALSGSVSAR